MSIRERAKEEMALVGIAGDDAVVMNLILTAFFTQWNSGGAVWAMAPVLQRLIAGKPLSPIEDREEDWVEVDVDPVDRETVYQHRRCGSVFKIVGERDGAAVTLKTYDNSLTGPDRYITFPYYPRDAVIDDPVVEVETKS